MTEASENIVVVPSEVQSSKLRACLSCGLVKSVAQFLAYGCENCPGLFEAGTGDRERVLTFTTAEFSGLVALYRPKVSWVAKWQRLSRKVPGCYAIGILAELPDDVLEELEALRFDVESWKLYLNSTYFTAA
jgi:transcription elongation factor SPT4